MDKIIRFMIFNISRIPLLALFILGFQSQVQGQLRFDYINDWSNIFLSNINRISETSFKNNDKIYRSKIVNLSFSSSSSFNDFYREKSKNLNRNVSFFNQMNVLKTNVSLHNQRIFIGARFGYSQKEMKYDLDESQSIQMRNGYKLYQFFLSTSLFKDYLTLGGSLGRKTINDIESFPWNFGLIFKPTQSISLAYQRFEDFFRWEYHFKFEDPSFLLLADEYSQLDEFQIQLKLFSELHITAGMQNNYINRNRTIDVSESTLIPSGTHYQRNIMINLFPESQFTMNFNYYNRTHDLTGYFYDSYQVFGKITEQKDHSEFYQSELLYRTQSQNIGMSFGWARGMMRMNGHIESWPFTPTLIDLLGIRYNVKSNLTYDIFRVGASYCYNNLDWQFSFSSTFEKINPGGRAKTWEPEAFVFGVKNSSIYSLSTNSRNGLYLGLQVSKTFGQMFRIAYEFHQYVPLELYDSDGSSNQSGMGQNNQSIHKSIYGGGKHELFLLINL
jgi:hypothetical protein